MNTSRRYLITAIASAIFAVASYADTRLVIWDGFNTVTIDDNVGPDTNPLAGFINYSGIIGDWNVAYTAGIVVQGGSSPVLDLGGSVLSNANANGTLNMWFLSNDFGPSANPSGYSGVMTGSSTANSFYYGIGYNTSNQITSGTWASGSPVYSSTLPINVNGTFPGGTLYGLNEQLGITARGASFTSFDAYATVPDSASTALMIGLGLLGLGLAARRNKVA